MLYTRQGLSHPRSVVLNRVNLPYFGYFEQVGHRACNHYLRTLAISENLNGDGKIEQKNLLAPLDQRVEALLSAIESLEAAV